MVAAKEAHGYRTKNMTAARDVLCTFLLEPHRDGNCLSPKDYVMQTVLDMKEYRQACTLEILLKREFFDEEDS